MRWGRRFPSAHRGVFAEGHADEASATGLHSSEVHWFPCVAIIDDEPDMTMWISARLTRSGMCTHVANTGAEALLVLDQAPVDLAILDLLMPDINGLDVLAYMQRSAMLRHTPVIILSGLVRAAHQARGLQAGATEYLTKPTTSLVLLAAIARVLHTATPDSARTAD